MKVTPVFTAIRSSTRTSCPGNPNVSCDGLSVLTHLFSVCSLLAHFLSGKHLPVGERRNRRERTSDSCHKWGKAQDWDSEERADPSSKGSKEEAHQNGDAGRRHHPEAAGCHCQGEACLTCLLFHLWPSELRLTLSAPLFQGERVLRRGEICSKLERKNAALLATVSTSSSGPTDEASNSPANVGSTLCIVFIFFYCSEAPGVFAASNAHA